MYLYYTSHEPLFISKDGEAKLKLKFLNGLKVINVFKNKIDKQSVSKETVTERTIELTDHLKH